MEAKEKRERDDKTERDLLQGGGGVTAENGRECFYCLNVIGQIEGHYVQESNQKTTKYEHLIPLLFALEEDERIDGILILLNTMGGDVEAGLAISEVIASLDKPTVSVVLGGGHSIGVPLAVSAKRSFIVPSATMTVHPVRTTGTVISAPQSFEYLREMQDRIVRFVVDHSRVDRVEFERVMMRTDVMANDIGSVLDGEAAVKCGLIDGIGGIREALAALREMAGVPTPPKKRLRRTDENGEAQTNGETRTPDSPANA